MVMQALKKLEQQPGRRQDKNGFNLEIDMREHGEHLLPYFRIKAIGISAILLDCFHSARHRSL
jgi:hypothetical protein